MLQNCWSPQRDSSPCCCIERATSHLITIAYTALPTATDRMDIASPPSFDRKGVLPAARASDRFSGSNVTLVLRRRHTAPMPHPSARLHGLAEGFSHVDRRECDTVRRTHCRIPPRRIFRGASGVLVWDPFGIVFGSIPRNSDLKALGDDCGYECSARRTRRPPGI